MYEAHYGFREKPFSLLPDPSFLYLSKKHRMALAMLEYGLANQAGFTVVSGGIGTGKTTLIRHLLNNLEQDITVGLISNTHRSFGELLQWILLAFNLDYRDKGKVELYQAFVDFMIQEYARNRRTVLIVDEAQNMAPETLEELRMLSNVNADKDQVLQVVLVGQEELRDTLRRPDLVQFAQRITVDYHLTPLTAGETRDLIRHRLEAAGGDPELFTEEAAAIAHRFSGGVPRLVNLLCDTALVYGYAEQLERIDADLMQEVVREKQAGGLFPAPPPGAARTDQPEPAAPGVPPASIQDAPAAGTPPRARPAATVAPMEKAAPAPASGTPDPALIQTRPFRVAIVGESAVLRRHLRRLIEPYNIRVIGEFGLEDSQSPELNPYHVDILLIDISEAAEDCTAEICDLISEWNIPVLFNDCQQTQASLDGRDPQFAQRLVAKLVDLLPPQLRADPAAARPNRA
ncbi:ExeA family protein [Thiohalobacter thiocyanaticus]|uniref:ExeA family protein n=1 Tax=Thiohalobacter thiocyanaticus TaxID=585455 RepID=UPI0019D4DF74|nr:AAA family ATPase [Thiohalobacter thiocyanaticus]